jgi:hypothetical protein
VRVVVLLGALLVVVAGCGGRSDEAPAAHAAKAPFARCSRASGGFRACTVFSAPGERTALYWYAGSDWKVVRGGLAGRAGWWRRVVPSPDHRMLLAQWSGECELQSTYLVSASDGGARPVFAGHASEAIGWTISGLARVRLVDQDWRGGTLLHRPGLYLIEPRTMRVRLERLVAAPNGC